MVEFVTNSRNSFHRVEVSIQYHIHTRMIRVYSCTCDDTEDREENTRLLPVKRLLFLVKDEDNIEICRLADYSSDVEAYSNLLILPRQILARIRSFERKNRRWSGELLDSNFYWQPASNLHFTRIAHFCFTDPRRFPSHTLSDVSLNSPPSRLLTQCDHWFRQFPSKQV